MFVFIFVEFLNWMQSEIYLKYFETNDWLIQLLTATSPLTLIWEVCPVLSVECPVVFLLKFYNSHLWNYSLQCWDLENTSPFLTSDLKKLNSYSVPLTIHQSLLIFQFSESRSKVPCSKHFWLAQSKFPLLVLHFILYNLTLTVKKETYSTLRVCCLVFKRAIYITNKKEGFQSN